MDVPAVAAVVRNGPATPVVGAAAALRTAGGHTAGHEQLAAGQPDNGPAEKERRTSARVGADAARALRRHRPSPKERDAAERAAEEASDGDDDGERQVHPNGRRPEATHTRLLLSPSDDFAALSCAHAR